MDESPIEEREFVFALPLRWPGEEGDRKIYERALIDYAMVMRPLLAAADSNERRELLDTLSVFARELRDLWSPGAMPAEISEFLTIFD